MKAILEWILNHWIAVGLATSWVIQISPIKWNPWSAIAKLVTKALTSELTKKVDGLEATMQGMKRDNDENEKDRIRYEVLSFANECRRHIDHTKEEFDHVISLKAKYDSILKRTDDHNGVFEANFNRIMEIYHECLRTNNFPQ